MNPSIAHSFNRAAERYDRFATLQRNVANTLFSYVPSTLPEGVVVDLGCGTGYACNLFRTHINPPSFISLDIAYDMCYQAQKKSTPQLGAINADIQSLPFGDRSVTFVFSSLSMHWCHDIAAAFNEVMRVLKPGGGFAISLVGDGSLYQLNHVFEKLDVPHSTNIFPSEHFVEELLKNAELSLYNLHLQSITDHYHDIFKLLHAIKNVGANAKILGKTRYLGKKFFHQADSLYRESFHKSNQPLPLTWKIIHITGVKA